MSEEYVQQQGNEELWKMLFATGDPKLQKMHSLHTKLPTKPRCRLCLAPFKGLGGWFMRLKGKKPNSRNPNYCNDCDKLLEAFPGGAEVEMSMLYVDIRQSTQYTQSNSAADVSQRINIFLNEEHASLPITMVL
jgi:adenylate cyclase